uniref:Uncharacterized protein n=1 Tax=Lutzomyia longipalpis TaxID=7200 RepID=A0A1B0CDM2_LUTLO
MDPSPVYGEVGLVARIEWAQKAPNTQSITTYSDDILTQTWFIVLLGSIIAIIVFLFGAMVLFKRIQFIKQTSLASMH